MPTIRDVMRNCVASVRPDDTLIDAVKILCKHHLSGVPVVTGDGYVVGFLSETDLMDVLFDMSARSYPVSAYMNSGADAIGPEDSIADAATMFALYGVRRLPVVDNGTLVGVVTRRDLLQHAITGAASLNEPLLELIPAIGEYA